MVSNDFHSFPMISIALAYTRRNSTGRQRSRLRNHPLRDTRPLLSVFSIIFLFSSLLPSFLYDLVFSFILLSSSSSFPLFPFIHFDYPDSPSLCSFFLYYNSKGKKPHPHPTMNFGVVSAPPGRSNPCAYVRTVK